MKDTSTVQFFDSSVVIKSTNEHIILIQDFKKEPPKEWYDNPIFITLIIPILVAFFVTILTNFINKRKDKVKIEKLIEETNQIKESYKPTVIATIQSVQDKLLINKIEGFKKLIKLNSQLLNAKQIYIEGEGLKKYEDYLYDIFRDFGSNYYTEFENFITDYSYFYNGNTFKVLNELSIEINGLYNNVMAFDSRTDPNKDPSNSDLEDILKISDLFKSAIHGIRSELHLDNNFIQDFIESKIYKKTNINPVKKSV